MLLKSHTVWRSTILVSNSESPACSCQLKSCPKLGNMIPRHQRLDNAKALLRRPIPTHDQNMMFVRGNAVVAAAIPVPGAH